MTHHLVLGPDVFDVGIRHLDLRLPGVDRIDSFI